MKKEHKTILWGAAGVVALFSLYLITVFGFWLSSKNNIYPGVSVAGVSLSGKTKKEATLLLQEAAPKEFYFDGEGAEGLEVSYLWEETAQKALEVGQRNPFFLGRMVDISPEFKYNKENLYKLLDAKNKKLSAPVVNGRVLSETTIKEGTEGKRLNFTKTAENFLLTVSNFRDKFYSNTFTVAPTFSGLDLDEHKKELSELIPQTLTLVAEEKEFQVNKEDIMSWATLSGRNPSYAKLFEGDDFYKPLLGTKNDSLFSSELVSDYLEGVSGQVNIIPKNATLSVEGEQVVVAQKEVTGRNLNVTKSTENVIGALKEKETTVTLVVDSSLAEIRSDNLAELGLVGLLSVGYSNFAGSPTNRIHNIQTGASKFNGVLIKPGQEFSFNTTLGPVDASTGYLPELVILDNKTQPQFGGGLCQVSSTAFRAALNAGLPITARKAHAYPVSYYKPFGVDASIYLPNPDLKFQNDTGKYIFIQTRVVGKNLYFDFYGTKPQRTITFAGNETGAGGVNIVEKVTPFVYDQGVRGNGSFTAVIYRFITDANGKTTSAKWISKYDSPDKYPH